MIRKLVKLTGGKVNVLGADNKIITQLQSDLSIQPSVDGLSLVFYKENVENPQLVAEWADLKNNSGVSLGSTIEQVVQVLGETYFFKSGSTGGTVTADDVTATANHRVITTQEGTNINIHGMTEKVAPLDTADEIGVWDSLTGFLRKVTLASFKTVILGWLGNYMTYQSAWDQVTNTPTLTDNDITKKGFVYRCSNSAVDTVRFGKTWNLGDQVIFNASGGIEQGDNSDTRRDQIGLATTDSPTFADVIISGLGTIFTSSTANSVKQSILAIVTKIGLLSAQAQRVTFSNSDYTITATTATFVAQIGTLTAPRTVTLPAANLFKVGDILTILDQSGSCSSTNTITVQRAGTDTIDGITNQVIAAPYGWRRFISDGVLTWSYDGGVLRSSNNLSELQDKAASRVNLGLGPSSSPTFAGVNTSTLQAVGSVSDADMFINPKGNGQIVIGGGAWAYNTQSSGKASLLLNNGSNDTPNLKFAYANNLNFGIDSAVTGTTYLSGQQMRFIHNSDEAGGAVIASFDINGNAAFTGTVYARDRLIVNVPNPTQKLQAHESTAATACYFKASNATSGYSSGNGVLFGIDAGLNGIVNNQSNGYFSFSTNNSEFMRVSASGIVQKKNTNGMKLQQTIGSDTDGDWWIWADTTGVYTQKRVSGAWVTKQTIS